MDEEDEHTPSDLYYPEGPETFDVETETGITESQDAIYSVSKRLVSKEIHHPFGKSPVW